MAVSWIVAGAYGVLETGRIDLWRNIQVGGNKAFGNSPGKDNNERFREDARGKERL